jgi:hypothetical protein
MPLHMTLLYPIPLGSVDGDVARRTVDALALQLGAGIRLECDTVCRFDTGIWHLPVKSTKRLTDLLWFTWQSFPTIRPYDLAYSAVVPHISISRPSAEPDIPAIEKALTGGVALRAVRPALWVQEGAEPWRRAMHPSADA